MTAPYVIVDSLTDLMAIAEALGERIITGTDAEATAATAALRNIGYPETAEASNRLRVTMGEWRALAGAA